MAISAHCQLVQGLGTFSFCRLTIAHLCALVKSGTAQGHELALLVLCHVQAQWSLSTFTGKYICVSEGSIGFYCLTLRFELLCDYEMYKENINPKSSPNSLL